MWFYNLSKLNEEKADSMSAQKFGESRHCNNFHTEEFYENIR